MILAVVLLSPIGALASEVTGTLSTGGQHSTNQGGGSNNVSGNVVSPSSNPGNQGSGQLSGRVASGNEALDGQVLGASFENQNGVMLDSASYAQAQTNASENATPDASGGFGINESTLSMSGRALGFGTAFAALLLLSYFVYSRYIGRSRQIM